MTSALTGETEAIARDVLAYVFSVPQTRWIDVDRSGLVSHAARRGLLLTDEDAEPFRSLRRRDEQLETLGWFPPAAVYHFSTRTRTARAGTPRYDRLVERYGPPPPPFHSVAATTRIELPLLRREEGLYSALARRRTVRRYDTSRALTLDQLATVLYEVFGCRGRARLHPEVEVLTKGAPSSGALHPVEVYPLLLRIEGVEPGLYHYSARDHALDALGPTADLAILSAGQDDFASAPAVFVLAARFRRSFWKYRRHRTAYATILMDAAHLSQALYLVAADLGLGAFFTNFVNQAAIDDALGFDGVEQGAIALCGCGHAAEEPAFEPYVPGAR